MLKIKPILALLGLSSALLTAALAQDDPVAVVNGEPISQQLYDLYAQQRARQLGAVNTPQARQQLVDELVTQELLVQQAREMGLEDDPQVAAQLELIRRNLLATQALQRMVQERTPSEEAVEQEYERLTTMEGGQKEYQARHILVDSQEQANELIQQLDEGADFAALAEQHSNDPGSAAQGGSLGWFSPDVMVQAFAQAVQQLEEGQVTQEPVQTQFGWHVIELTDVRDAVPPAIDELRPQITQQLQSQMLQEYIQGLRQEAEVEVNVAQ